MGKYHSYVRVSWRFESVYTLQGKNMITQRMHGLSDLTYGYIMLCQSEVKIAPLHLGRNLGSTVIDWHSHHPRLPHSPFNIHHRVAVMVQPSSYISYYVYMAP
jgi:hypothetical protein